MLSAETTDNNAFIMVIDHYSIATTYEAQLIQDVKVGPIQTAPVGTYADFSKASKPLLRDLIACKRAETVKFKMRLKTASSPTIDISMCGSIPNFESYLENMGGRQENTEIELASKLTWHIWSLAQEQTRTHYTIKDDKH